MQLFAEIFYDPYLLCDLELAIYSKDVQNVRSHLGQKDRPKQIDWSLYKSSKSVFVGLEPGEYEFALVYKNAGAANGSASLVPKIQSVQYQLQLILAKQIDRQQIIPASLNYFGLLGPTGENFGQMIYFCQDCVIEEAFYKTIEFEISDALSSTKDINFDVVVTSEDNSVDVKFEEVPSSSGPEKRMLGANYVRQGA